MVAYVILLSAVVMHRNAPSNPLTQRIRSEESVCCMLPLLSERKFLRVGSGPMNSAFHTSSHNDFNNRILHPAFVKIGIAERMKHCATRVLRASTMCHLWHNEGEPVQSLLCACSVCNLLCLQLATTCRNHCNNQAFPCVCSAQGPDKGAVQTRQQ